jgi:LacI family transcriptional regulator
VREAFYHLYDQGYRRLAFVSGAEDSFDNTERRQTFLEEAEKNGLSVACYPGNFTEESGYQAALPLIQSHSLPEAVFCANDQMAIGFIKALQANGLRVPEDVHRDILHRDIQRFARTRGCRGGGL